MGERFDRTGEFRCARLGEWYEGDKHGQPLQWVDHFPTGSEFWILRRTEVHEPEPAKEPANELVSELYKVLTQKFFCGNAFAGCGKETIAAVVSRFRPPCDRNAVIEECAKAVDRTFVSGLTSLNLTHMPTRDACALAIRSLKSKGGGE